MNIIIRIFENIFNSFGIDIGITTTLSVLFVVLVLSIYEFYHTEVFIINNLIF